MSVNMRLALAYMSELVRSGVTPQDAAFDASIAYLVKSELLLKYCEVDSNSRKKPLSLTPKGKPTITLVQDYVKTVDKQELAELAWKATQDLCK